MDSFKKIFHGHLTVRCGFFNSLKDECISEKDYLHTIDVWIMFKMKTTGDYHDLYLQTDVVFLSLLCHCFSSPGLSWEAMFKMTEIKLELISNIDIHLFVEKGMRVGIFYIAK